MVDRRLQFGWNLSAQYFCLCMDAIEYSHNHTTVDTAVITSHGKSATAHLRVWPTVEVEQTHLQRRVCFPRGQVGELKTPFSLERMLTTLSALKCTTSTPAMTGA